MMTISRRKRVASTLMCALSLLAVTAGPAQGDNVQNDVTTTDKSVSTTKGDLTGASVGFQIHATGGDSTDTTGRFGQSCNAADGSVAVLSVSGLPSGVTATPSTLSFNACETLQSMVFKASSSAVAGDYPITVSIADGGAVAGDYNTSPAGFTLQVQAASAPDCTTGRAAPAAPTISTNTPDTTTWFNSSTGAGRFTIAPAANAEYSLNGGAWTTYSGEVTLADGQHSVVARNFLPGTADCARVNGTESAATLLKIDLTPPQVSFANYMPTSPNGLNDWYTTNVTANFTASDATSGMADPTDSTPITGEGQNLTALSPAFTDNAGNTAPAGTATSSPAVKIDKTVPAVSVTGVASGQQYVLGSVPTPGCTTTDATSGVHTAASLSLSGGPVGSITASCSGAQDFAGLGNSASATYSVVYDWNGFFQPIDSPLDRSGVTPGATATGWNKAKAGSSIPVKFSLAGDQGLEILDGAPAVNSVRCPSGIGADLVEEYATGTTSGLKYDAVADQYNYTWKTTSSFAGTCQRLTVRLVDGTMHFAFFNFTK